MKIETYITPPAGGHFFPTFQNSTMFQSGIAEAAGKEALVPVMIQKNCNSQNIEHQ